ncbi:YadA-like family protein [Psychrobacter sp. FBL11]|uniref:YadA-like family protein n=1 Tax=Psychrobacter saeujeotis TaxID=3143436 RepID=A0ABU9X8H4_9GAMM|nr:YadA-like family protein [uncultured Psychrobacter sp.]
MNRNYKVIWNQSLNCFMAVAEYAKSRGKSSSTVVSSNAANVSNGTTTGGAHLLRLSALCIGLASAGFSMQASAIAACAEDNAAGASVVDRVQCGTGANAAGGTSVAIGQNAQATGGQSIAIGGVNGGQNTTASGDQSTAIGANAVSSGSSSIAIGGDDLNKASGTTVNQDGTETVGAVNSGEVNTIFKKYSGGRDLVDTSAGGNQYPNTASSGAASVAIGVQAVSSGALSTAFGTQANATGVASSAFGVSADASKEGSVAIGAGSKTDGSATKVESQTVNGVTFAGFDGASGFAGNASDAGRQVSVGLIGNERQIKNVAPGEISSTSTDAINGSQVFSVTNELVDNIRAAQATADAASTQADNAVQYDDNTKDNVTLGGANGTTITNVKAGDLSDNSTDAVNGSQLNATNQDVAANRADIDTNTGNISDLTTGKTGLVRQDTGTGPITVGAATGGTSVDFTNLAGDARTLTGVADGVNDNDAVNFGQLNRTVADNKVKYFSVNSTGGGNVNNDGAQGTNAIAIGKDAKVADGHNSSIAMGLGAKVDRGPDTGAALPFGAVAIGNKAWARGTNSVALGTDATTSVFDRGLAIGNKAESLGSDATAIGSEAVAASVGVALGNKAKAHNTRSIAIGDNAVAGVVGGDFADGASSYGIAIGQRSTVKGEASIAIGRLANTSGKDALAIGRESIAAANGTAIGAGAKANKAGGVAIGAGSIANIEAGIKGFDPSTGGATTKTSNVWQSTRAAVALGDSDNGVTRQLTGLAAGTNDSDAVNVAQLRSTNDRVTTNTDDIADLASGRTGIVRQDTGTGAITVGAQTGGTSVDFSNSTNENRKLTGIAAGTADNDAVNVGQLNTTNSNVATNASNITDNDNRSIGNLAALGGDAAYDAANDIYTAPIYTLNNGNNDAGTTGYNDVGSALGNLDGRTTDNTADIAKGFNISAAGGTNDNVQLGESVNFTNTDGNLVVTNTVDNGINYDLAENISVTQATIGDATNNTVLTSTVNGLDVGGDKITNLSNGSVAAGSSDAVTGDQLNTTNDNVAANRTDIDTNTSDIDDINAGRTGIVRLDVGTGAITVGAATGGTSVNFAGTDGVRTLSGLANGNVATGSTEAVTGNQLNTTNTNVTANRTDIDINAGNITDNSNRSTGNLAALGGNAAYDAATDTYTAPIYTLDDGTNTGSNTTVNNVGGALGNLDTRTTTNTADINKGISVGNGTTDNNFALGDTINVTGDSNITSTTTTGGVQVSLNESVDLGANGSFTAGNSVLNNTGLTITGGPSVTSAGINTAGNKITNVDDGTDAGDAVNFGQLEASSNAADTKTNALGNSTASNLGGGANYNAATGAVSAPSYTLDDGTNTGTNAPAFNNVGAALTNLDGRTTTNTSDIDDINAGRTGIVRQDAGTGAITVGAQTGGTSVNFTGTDGVRTLSGLANGNVATGSTEAVTGDQLNTTNSNVTDNNNRSTGNLAALGGGAAYDAANDIYTAPSYLLDDGTNTGTNAPAFSNVGDALGNLDTRTTTNTADINKGISVGNGTTDNNFALGDTINVTGDSNITSTTTTGGVQVSLNDNIDVNRITAGNSTLNNAGVTIVDGPNNTVTLSGTGLNNGNNRIANLADGIAPNDAATFGQLTDTNNIATGNLSALGGDAAYDAATDTYTAPTYTLDNGSNTGTNSDFDNVGSALGNLDGRTTANTSGLADLASGRTGLVRQDTGTSAITVGAQTGGTSVDFTNVGGDARQLTGVASAGDISLPANANTAVNAGDVNAAVTGLTNAGLQFSGDNNTATPFTRKLGEELKVRGGATDLTDNNIGVVASTDDTLTVKLAENIDLGADGSVTTGNTLMNNTGLSVNDGAGNATTITTAGISVVDADGNNAGYTAASSSLSDDQGNTNVSTATGNTITTGNNVTTTTGTGTTVTDGTNTSNYGADGFTATDGINSTTVGTDRISISGTDNTDPANPVSNTLVLDGNTGQISGVADATAADQAINKGQLDAIASAGNTKADALGASTASNLGGGASYNAATGVVSAPTYTLDNGANTGTDTTVNNVGSALENLDGRTTNNTSDIDDINAGRTGIVRQDAGTGAITVGAQTGGTSVNFTNSADKARQLTGVADGTNATDAVNKRQLDAITGNISASGVQYDRNNDNTVNYDRVSFAGTPAVIEQNDSGNNIVVSGGTTLTNVANGVNASDAVNKGQLDSATKVKVFDSNGGEVTINVAEQVANTSVDNNNLDSLFLTYDKTGQEVTDRLTIGQTVQKMNTEGVKFAHTNARDNGAGGIGMTNDSSAGGFDSTAIGVNAIIKEGADSTVALGHDTEATETAKNSVVIGKGSKVSGASSVAIGDGAQANGNQSISIGTGNIVDGNNSGAFGDPSTINGDRSYAVGNNNTINSDDTFVIGNGITANQNGSVVLGLGSAATTGAGIVGFGAAGNAAITATTSTTGAVAVGDAANGVYRQVTGVAAGTADSDAVNVSQLKAVNDKIDNNNTAINDAAVQYDKNQDGTVNKGNITLGGAGGTTITNVANGVQSSDAVNKGQLDNLGSGVAGIIGGDASYDADGNLTANNIGGTGQGNISDAIAAVNQGNAQANEDIQANNEQITDNTGRLDAGISFGADNGDNISQSVGGNNGSIQFEGGNNITTSTANGGIQIGLDGNIEVDSVTTGNTVVSDNGVTIKDGPSMTTEGFNAANTVITGVEAGRVAADSTDAVNGGQLHALDKKLGDSVNALGYRIGEVEDDANAGISAAMAMSSLPQAYIPGKSMVGGGIASYNGESAVAVGVSKVSDNGRWVIKVNGTADTQGNAGGAIGAGFHF